MARQISWRGVLSPDGAGDGRPVETQVWRPGTPLVPPRSIVEAARVMQFAGVLSLLEIARAFLTRNDLRSAFAGESRAQGVAVGVADLDRIVTLSLTITVVYAIISATTWFTMAKATQQGSKWGRWGACALMVVAFGVFAGGLLPTAGPFSRVFALALLMLGIWALVLLWRKDSSAWIRFTTAPED
ncbi:MAG: hypothetical protein ABIQ13_05845 [Pedococcus sp.]